MADPDPGVASFDVYVTKVRGTTGEIIWSAYLGGNANDDSGGIAVDSTGAAVVTGFTYSADFPVVNGFQTTLRGTDHPFLDAFVAKLHPSGASILWSSFLGGTGGEFANAVALGSDGSVFVTGDTSSPDFNALQGPAWEGGAFVAKIHASGSSVLWSRLVGGSRQSSAYGVQVDAQGHPVVVGTTAASNLAAPGGFDTSYAGEGDGFVAKLDGSGNPLWSSYLGGAGGDTLSDVSLDASGNVYVTGTTRSADFPLTRTFGVRGEDDAFVARIRASGSALSWAVALAGVGFDRGESVAVDGLGNVFVAGVCRHWSQGFPAAGPVQDEAWGSWTGWVARLNADASRLFWCKGLGGGLVDSISGIVADGRGGVYAAGTTESPDFPMTGGDLMRGRADAFVVRLSQAAPGPVVRIVRPPPGQPNMTFEPAIELMAETWDERGVASVAWRNETTGQSGTSPGGAFWSSVIGLAPGPNTLTVTATNIDGLTGLDTVVVRRADPARVNYIGFNSTWLYEDTGTGVPGWPALGAGNWKEGLGVFGYGEAYVHTPVSFGGNASLKHLTTYFGSYFNGGDPTLIRSLRIGVKVDDGFVAFLNGVEVARFNMPAGPVTKDTRAVAAVEGNVTREFDLTPHRQLLQSGLNQLAFEVHQQSPSSSDLVFDATLWSTLYLEDDSSPPWLQVDDPHSTSTGWRIHLGSYDNVAVSSIEVFQGDAFLGYAVPTGSQSFAFDWDTRSLGNGKYDLVFKAHDPAGNVTTRVQILTVFNGGRTRRTLIPARSTWKYYDRAELLPSTWTNNNMSDADWSSGPGPLGYGESYLATRTSFGSDPSRKPVTTFFRKVVPVDGINIQDVTVRVMYDDGFVLWMNGYPVLEVGLPPLPSATRTAASHEAQNRYEEFTFHLQQSSPSGTCLFAVEVHQDSPASSDMVFDMEVIADGFATNPAPPALTIVSPLPDAVVSGTVPVEVSVVAEHGIFDFELLVDGVKVTEVPAVVGRAFVIPWNTLPLPDGEYTLTVRPYISQPESPPVRVRVDNRHPASGRVLPRGSAWRYQDVAGDLGTAWRGSDFDDRFWKGGKGPLGYGENYLSTLLSYGPNASQKPMTIYFRKAVWIDEPGTVRRLVGRAMYDDGFVLYVNGTEALRRAMPAGTVSFSTPAAGHEAGNAYEAFDLSALRALLRPGLNVVAVEVHQQAPSSSDLVLDLELEIER